MGGTLTRCDDIRSLVSSPKPAQTSRGGIGTRCAPLQDPRPLPYSLLQV